MDSFPIQPNLNHDPFLILDGRKDLDPTSFSYKLIQAGQFGLDVHLDDLNVDETTMSCWIKFSDGNSRDGVGDVTEISGINTERHRKNPIVLFDHGKGCQLPIALTECPETNEYTVILDPVARVGRAKCFFYQGKKNLPESVVNPSTPNYSQKDHAKFCYDIFDMLAQKFIRGGSFAYQIIKAERMQPDYSLGTPPGLHLISTRLLELGPTVIPAHQDTVAKMLSMPGRSDIFYKSLSAYAPSKKAMVVSGWEGEKRHPEGPQAEAYREGRIEQARIKRGEQNAHSNINDYRKRQDEERRKLEDGEKRAPEGTGEAHFEDNREDTLRQAELSRFEHQKDENRNWKDSKKEPPPIREKRIQDFPEEDQERENKLSQSKQRGFIKEGRESRFDSSGEDYGLDEEEKALNGERNWKQFYRAKLAKIRMLRQKHGASKEGQIDPYLQKMKKVKRQLRAQTPKEPTAEQAKIRAFHAAEPPPEALMQQSPEAIAWWKKRKETGPLKAGSPVKRSKHQKREEQREVTRQSEAALPDVPRRAAARALAHKIYGRSGHSRFAESEGMSKGPYDDAIDQKIASQREYTRKLTKRPSRLIETPRGTREVLEPLAPIDKPQENYERGTRHPKRVHTLGTRVNQTLSRKVAENATPSKVASGQGKEVARRERSDRSSGYNKQKKSMGTASWHDDEDYRSVETADSPNEKALTPEGQRAVQADPNIKVYGHREPKHRLPDPLDSQQQIDLDIQRMSKIKQIKEKYGSMKRAGNYGDKKSVEIEVGTRQKTTKQLIPNDEKAYKHPSQVSKLERNKERSKQNRDHQTTVNYLAHRELSKEQPKDIQEVGRQYHNDRGAKDLEYAVYQAGLRHKYKGTGGSARCLKKSQPGTFVVYCDSKHINKLREEADRNGIKILLADDDKGISKVRLTGLDDAVNRVAQKYGKPGTIAKKNYYKPTPVESQAQDFGHEVDRVYGERTTKPSTDILKQPLKIVSRDSGHLRLLREKYRGGEKGLKRDIGRVGGAIRDKVTRAGRAYLGAIDKYVATPAERAYNYVTSKDEKPTQPTTKPTHKSPVHRSTTQGVGDRRLERQTPRPKIHTRDLPGKPKPKNRLPDPEKR